MQKFIAARFEALSNWIAAVLGTPVAFLLACTVVGLWALTGPYFQYSDTWQLVINTSTTIITFLMVFLLQNTGNRTIEEMHENIRDLHRQNERLHDQLEALRRSLDDRNNGA